MLTQLLFVQSSIIHRDAEYKTEQTNHLNFAKTVNPNC